MIFRIRVVLIRIIPCLLLKTVREGRQSAQITSRIHLTINKLNYT